MSGFSFYSYSIFFIVFIFLIIIMFFISIRDDLRWSLLVFRPTVFYHFSYSNLLSFAILSLQFCLRHISRFQNVEHLPGLPPATDPVAARVGFVKFDQRYHRYHRHRDIPCMSFHDVKLFTMNRKTHQWNTMCRELHGNSGPGQWITTSKLVGFQKYPAMDKVESCQTTLRLRNLGAILYCLDTLNMRHCTCLFQITSFHKHTSLISMIQGTLASIANSGRWGRRSVDSAASCCWSANIACWSTLIAFQIIGSFSSNLIRFKEVKGIQTHTEGKNGKIAHSECTKWSQRCQSTLSNVFRLTLFLHPSPLKRG